MIYLHMYLCLFIYSNTQWDLEGLEWKCMLMDLAQMLQTPPQLPQKMYRRRCDAIPAKEVNCNVPTAENYFPMTCLRTTWGIVRETISDKLSLHEQDCDKSLVSPWTGMEQ